MPLNPLSPSILVIDDEAVALKLSSSLLAKAFPTHTVHHCDGEAALAKINELRPGIVVTDLYMPGTDGLTIVAETRIKFPELPVVVMTARGSEEAAVKALRAGAASYVPKQRLSDELVDTVRWILAVRAQRHKHEEVFGFMSTLERTFTLPNRSELIAPVVAELQSDLRRLGVCPEQDLVRFGVAMTETLMNAMIHGNLGLPGKLVEQGTNQFRKMVEERLTQQPYADRRVHIYLKANREEAVCRIRDEGEGFAPADLPDPTDPEMLCRPHGRGLLLIRTFMDDVQFNDRGNEITLIKRCTPPVAE